MMEAILSLKIPKIWMTEISQKYPAIVKILERKPFGKYGVQDLVEISATDEYLGNNNRGYSK